MEGREDSGKFFLRRRDTKMESVRVEYEEEGAG